MGRKKKELMEPQRQNPFSESRSAEVWHQQSGKRLYELGWQIDRFLITKLIFLTSPETGREYLDNHHTNSSPGG